MVKLAAGVDVAGVRLDAPDVMEFMLGTGERIGEAAAVRQAVLDLDVGAVQINGTVVRVNGTGPSQSLGAARACATLPASCWPPC